MIDLMLCNALIQGDANKPTQPTLHKCFKIYVNVVIRFGVKGYIH